MIHYLRFWMGRTLIRLGIKFIPHTARDSVKVAHRQNHDQQIAAITNDEHYARYLSEKIARWKALYKPLSILTREK